ncbi:hypothetical protein ILUMI_13549 [Ignelater luminosus]|uniref:Uncharacterized protein n=1 Tax=Ignelater luminosus TaxID=2038154 RepID=A0A8K0CWI0_IGNLU|nr:hypothetical protein ILUMI_13549 [Ignelater luminosus]
MKSLKKLSIINCNIKNVKPGAFYGLNNLEYLNLKGSGIIPEDNSFSKTTEMLFLQLEDNNITEITADTFRNLQKLGQLLLDHNKLSYLGNNVFKGFDRLEIISLSSNYIKEIDEDAFYHLGTLRMFYLSNNILTNIPVINLKQYNNLTVLDLGFNRIRSIPDNSFANFTALEELVLEGNKIGTIAPLGFSNLVI